MPWSLRPIVTDTLQSVELPDRVSLGSVWITKMTVGVVFLSKVQFQERLMVAPCVAAN